jgi:hypothetical protein
MAPVPIKDFPEIPIIIKKEFIFIIRRTQLFPGKFVAIGCWSIMNLEPEGFGFIKIEKASKTTNTQITLVSVIRET